MISSNICEIRTSFLESPRGKEVFLSLCCQKALGFNAALVAIKDAYMAECRNLGLGADTEVKLQFFFSDIQNQFALLNAQWQCSPSAFICAVGQAPVEGSYLVLQAWHLQSKSLKKELLIHQNPFGGIVFHHGGYSSLLTAHFPDADKTTLEQSGQIIDSYLALLEKNQGHLSKDALRTWFYVRDIDNNYLDMVGARTERYEQHGLTPKTHFVASTGIEGTSSVPSILSWLLAWTTLGIQPEQRVFISAPSHLPPTHVYGVNFERATWITFGDRSHIHVSGTASIDAQGNVMHLDDIISQTYRVAENIRILLEKGNMSMTDLRSIIVYLRDIGEYPNIAPLLDELFPCVPRVVVRGAVCRPQWLIEIEGIAGTAQGNSDFAPYC